MVDWSIAGTVSGLQPADPREAVTLGCRVLGSADQSDLVWGHLSMRDPDGRGAWMKSSGWGFEEMTPERIVLVDRDGNCVVHTHSPSAAAFGATGEDLRPVSDEANFFVPPAMPRFTDTTDLILTRELGEALAAALGDCRGALMINHGVVVAAPDIPTAVVATVLLERACRTQLAAMAAGGVQHWSSEEESRAKREHCYPVELIQQAWDYLVRRLPD